MHETWYNMRNLIEGNIIKWDGESGKYVGRIERVDAIKGEDYYEFMTREIDSKTLYAVRSNRDDIEVLTTRHTIP